MTRMPLLKLLLGNPSPFPLVLVPLAISLTMVPDRIWSQEKLDFNRDIRPILSAACFRCHGFDAKKREADLRLDTAEGAIQKRGDNPPAILPGDPDSSLMMARILASDSDQVMPPPSAKRQLTDEEKKLLRRWILEGAPYKQHWSFEAISNPPVPEVQNVGPEWQSSTIDRFLVKEMQRLQLKPQPEADKQTLIRRVSFTLTGLPPSLLEIAEFESDHAAGAYERMVDRYLKSIRFGEEMARHWLDVARYGDTHGLHLDNDRSMWAYRDWVVNAFNENLPFSQFTIEQIAGDLLPSPTQSQLVATGFNRCNVTTSEGGAIAEEFLYRYAVDRTSNVVQTWLGLTAGCAVCHDHKYDPLTMKDFYSLYSFFYSAADPAMDGNINTTAPFQPLPTKQQSIEQERRRGIEAAAKRALLEIGAKKRSSLKESKSAVADRTILDVWLDDELPLGASGRNTTRNADRWSNPGQLEVPMGQRALYQSFGNKYEQSATGGLVVYTIPENPKIDVWVRLDPLEPPRAIYLEIKGGKTTKRFAWASSDEESKLVGVEGELRVGDRPEPGSWQKLSIDLARFDFKPGADLQEFKLGQFGGVCWWDGLTCSGTARAKEDLRTDFKAWAASRKGKETPYADSKVSEALKKGEESDLWKEQSESIEGFFEAMIAADPDPEVVEARRKWRQARIELALLESEIPGTFIFKDLPEPRKSFVMVRGQYDQKGEGVEPTTPSFLPSLKLGGEASRRPNRLDLANWIVSEDHPLPARVAVNRFWQQIFGTGLVRTSEDFGSQGALPTHPELLDHLAFRFRKEGWDVKKLLKELVMTAAFRQSSVVVKESLEIDPENRYLSRGPRIRLDAEQIRDNALAVSGLINLQMGGPGVKSYQPSNIWEPVGYGDSNTRYYVQDHGDALYRRSLYCYIKRTAPPPFMSNFDAPNREMFCARRERSNTPLQALQLLNDVQHFEAARKLGERILREAGETPEERIRYLYRVVLARMPDDFELRISLDALQQFQKRMQANPLDAIRITKVGESKASSILDQKELATYALLGNMILNLDETVVRN